jgi:membrane protein implicated in regulation of membrane protease activity
MNKITTLKVLQAAMVFFAMFELYVAYVSPTLKYTIQFIIFSLFSMITFLMLNQKVSKLKRISDRIER